MSPLGYVLAAIVGFFGGSVINYLADVLPVHRNLVQPTCRSCGAKQPWLSLILPRSCPGCQQPVPIRKWLVLVASLVVSIAFWINPPQRFGYWLGFILLVYLGVVFTIDLEHRLVLHPVSFVGFGIGIIVGTGLHGFWMTIAGGAAGFCLMFGLYYLGDIFARFLAKMRGQTLDEVALGFGDVMLCGVLGFIMGWPGIIAGIVLAILLGGVVSIIYIFYRLINRSYKPFMAIPYAPFLIMGAILLLFR